MGRAPGIPADMGATFSLYFRVPWPIIAHHGPCTTHGPWPMRHLRPIMARCVVAAVVKGKQLPVTPAALLAGKDAWTQDEDRQASVRANDRPGVCTGNKELEHLTQNHKFENQSKTVICWICLVETRLKTLWQSFYQTKQSGMLLGAHGTRGWL